MAVPWSRSSLSLRGRQVGLLPLRASITVTAPECCRQKSVLRLPQGSCFFQFMNLLRPQFQEKPLAGRLGAMHLAYSLSIACIPPRELFSFLTGSDHRWALSCDCLSLLARRLGAQVETKYGFHIKTTFLGYVYIYLRGKERERETELPFSGSFPKCPA